jgi:Acetyl-coenzyme A synthetase N-terminus/AMP-binding enzyme
VWPGAWASLLLVERVLLVVTVGGPLGYMSSIISTSTSGSTTNSSSSIKRKASVMSSSETNNDVAEATEDHHAHDIPLVVPPIVHNTDPTNSEVTSLEQYQARYAQSIANPAAFWAAQAQKRLTWYHNPYDTSKTTTLSSTTPLSCLSGGFEHGDVTWFAGAKLNVCYNTIDRHVENGKGDDIAILWEGDEVNDIRRLTYAQVQRKTCQIANALLAQGVQKGDVVTIYMPMSTCVLSL